MTFPIPKRTSSAPDAFLAATRPRSDEEETPAGPSIQLPSNIANNHNNNDYGDDVTPRLLKCIEFINSALDRDIDSTPRDLTYPTEESPANAAASSAFYSAVNPAQPARVERNKPSAAELAAQSSLVRDPYLAQDTLEANLNLFCKALNDLSFCNGENNSASRRLNIYKIKLINMIEEQKRAAASIPENEELLSKLNDSISRIEAAYTQVTERTRSVI